uniref:DUF5710 domain-containing protein n=1 Tax=Chromera velia CCMP2878 TaxID=1169474 RepID=A0A0G4IG15_9ALVE|eukprot:Cvel_126.t1-p1 / transcript=Cvel_126.t1 / gene=Cvel_126 / organism=Chromera_velia_CCMP2878 / gene_product=DNA primase TraC, putative / transcript_product=DNA primase TraC, putative / location=Cvel_scaffold9:70020-72623(-) / protein_length=713 / sequence_SO=supercontig / SO=protein_coding / is_pseudo=false
MQQTTPVVSTSQPERLFLDCPFSEKDQVKGLGGQWDANAKKWFVPRDRNRAAFNRWLPSEDHVFLSLPNEEETEEAKRLGARWNPKKRQFYITPYMNSQPFSRWLPASAFSPSASSSLAAAAAAAAAAPPPPPHTPSDQVAPTDPNSSTAHRNSTVMVSHGTPVAMTRAQALSSGDARSDIITVLKIEPATLNDLIFCSNSHSGGVGEGEGEGHRGRTLLKMEAIAESELLQMSHRLGWRTLNSPVLSLLASDLQLLGGSSTSQPSPSGSSADCFSHWINACADELGRFLVTQNYLVTHGRLSCRQDASSHIYTPTLGSVVVKSSLAASGLSQPRSALTCEAFRRLLYVCKCVLSLSRDKRALLKRRMESLKRSNLADRLKEEMNVVMECAKELAKWIRKPENDALFEGLDLSDGVRVSDNFDEVSVWRGGTEGDGLTDPMMSLSQTFNLEMEAGDAGWRVVWTCSKFTSQFLGGGFFSDPSLVREAEEEVDKDGMSFLLQSASIVVRWPEDEDLQFPLQGGFSSVPHPSASLSREEQMRRRKIAASRVTLDAELADLRTGETRKPKPADLASLGYLGARLRFVQTSYGERPVEERPEERDGGRGASEVQGAERTPKRLRQFEVWQSFGPVTFHASNGENFSVGEVIECMERFERMAKPHSCNFDGMPEMEHVMFEGLSKTSIDPSAKRPEGCDPLSDSEDLSSDVFTIRYGS